MYSFEVNRYIVIYVYELTDVDRCRNPDELTTLFCVKDLTKTQVVAYH